MSLNPRGQPIRMIAVFALSNLIASSAFTRVAIKPAKIGVNPYVPLFAKGGKRKKATKTSNVGGFGKVTEATPEAISDYSVFPTLEKEVEDSLISSPPELQEAGALPAEVYDRLDQIYGFPNFNYQCQEEDPKERLSFENLTSAPGDADEPTQASSSISDVDFADLLASATGGDVDTPTRVISDKNDSGIGAIGDLPQFTTFRVLHVDPLVLAIDDFFTEEECDRYVSLSSTPSTKGEDAPFQTRSMTVGKDAQAKLQRTSTTWFHHYKNLPELMAKASRLLGLDGISRWEEPQTVRYRQSEKFTWHLDALSPTETTQDLGGQRTATLLVYLTELESGDGGATMFRDLLGSTGMLKVQPKKGSALLFFPSAGGIPNTPLDIRTLHCGEAVDSSCSHDKWISQLWLRESKYCPSAPPGNQHEYAKPAISEYCKS